jgi:hypothetical protein
MMNDAGERRAPRASDHRLTENRMYAATLLFSRLLLIGMLAFPVFAFVVGVTHTSSIRSTAIPPCHHHGAHQASFDIEEAAFGISSWENDTGYVFTETDHVHLVPGTTFGWRLKLREPMSSVMLREEFVLPAAPAYWGLGPDTRLNEDRTVATTERRVSPTDGWLSREWTLTAGDPPGDYEMRVFLNDELVKTFHFNAHSHQ